MEPNQSETTTDTVPTTTDEQPHTSNGEETTTTAPKEEEGTIDHNALMGILCYLGPLLLVPYLTERENPFIKFHLKQGLVLLGFALLSWILTTILTTVLFFLIILVVPLIVIFNLFLLVLMVIGIVNAVKGEMKPLPLVGGLSRKFKI